MDFTLYLYLSLEMLIILLFRLVFPKTVGAPGRTYPVKRLKMSWVSSKRIKTQAKLKLALGTNQKIYMNH